MVMGKCTLVERILPVKQRYESALFNVISAVLRIQRWCRKAVKQVRAKKALMNLNKFVLGYHFDQCRELFYADLFRVDDKKEDKQDQKFERENRLRKLRPMKNRMLYFKNRTFKIDTLNRDVQWATEKRLTKTSTAPLPAQANNSGSLSSASHAQQQYQAGGIPGAKDSKYDLKKEANGSTLEVGGQLTRQRMSSQSLAGLSNEGGANAAANQQPNQFKNAAMARRNSASGLLSDAGCGDHLQQNSFYQTTGQPSS